ncbi:MAG TPA: hypothetical protein DD437_14660 [Rhodobiaceae bacterium]|nr:hypothetical protein [Rhodobiaceae bacterium]
MTLAYTTTCCTTRLIKGSLASTITKIPQDAVPLTTLHKRRLFVPTVWLLGYWILRLRAMPPDWLMWRHAEPLRKASTFPATLRFPKVDRMIADIAADRSAHVWRIAPR